MRFDHQKAFPYPVLRYDVDDYIDGEFQVLVDMEGSDDGTKITAHVRLALSVAEIQQEIDKGNAAFVIVFTCRETFFREPCMTNKKEFKKELDSSLFKGEVNIYPFIMATRKIVNFKCKDINPEFEAESFIFEKGEVLAAEEPSVLYIDRDLFKPVSSVFELVKSDSVTGHEWRLAFEQDKVQIQVSEIMKETLDRARNASVNRAILLNSIYFAAVMEAIQVLKESDTFEEYRWAKIIKQQCHNMGIDFEKHANHSLAQQLLKYPFALMEKYVFAEDK